MQATAAVMLLEEPGNSLVAAVATSCANSLLLVTLPKHHHTCHKTQGISTQLPQRICLGMKMLVPDMTH